jgi:hypothetical protein
MIAQPTATATATAAPLPRTERIEIVEPISLKCIVAALQVVLATRRAANRDEDTYWYTLARGM